MASAVTELEVGLQAMSALKPPGVSGTRIASLTALCVANVQSESVLIQKIYTHFKKTDGSHKLGVLYVVDSVTRKWLDQAKSQGHAVDGSAKDGTFAAGVHRVTELMPVLMNDIIQTAPPTQKDKLMKLLDIWEKGQTFPQPLIDSFRTRLETHSTSIKSTTPEGSPPPGLMASLGIGNHAKPPAFQAPAPAPLPTQRTPSAQGSNAIMEALANLTRQNNNPPPAQLAMPVQPPAPVPMPSHTAPPPQTQAALSNLSSLLSSLASHSTPTQTQPPSFPQQPPAAPQNHMSFPYPSSTPAYGNASIGGYPAPQAPPALPPAGSAGLNPDMQQQVMLIKALADQGVPFDKIPALIQTMQAAGALPATGALGGQPTAPQPSYGAPQGWGDYQGADKARSPERYSRRSRSRSPGRRWDGRQDQRGSRDDYGRYDEARGSRTSEYRQRSPVGRRQNGDPMNPPAHRGEDKWVEFDRTLPDGHIRVFSRTLFVGGVTCSEKELRDIFNQYGQVQTCIVNRDKRHAFVKMITRKDALAAKEAMEFPQGPNGLQLRTRWGVGFGPRHCSDYSTGISVIPISALTEADRKWMLTAEIGGSGGKNIESGLVVEEPDIEIGAGVSSKAISRRMQTDKSGSHGPRSTRTGDAGWSGRGKGGRREDNQASGANAQPLPQFGSSNGAMMPGMPMGMPTQPQGYGYPPNGY